MPPTLIIVCGLSGAGKTTHGKALAEKVGAIRLSPDEWMETLTITLGDEDLRGRIEALQWDLTNDLLRLGQSVIIEWGTWARAEREALRDDAQDLGAAVELHYLSQSVDVLWIGSRVEAPSRRPSVARI